MDSSSGIGNRRIGGGNSRPVNAGTGDARARQRAIGPTADPDTPAVRRSGQHRDRQFILVEGRRFDRNAPRGTYLDILV